MRLLFNNFYFGFYLCCMGATSQVDEVDKCFECQLFATPVLGENFIIGEDLEEIKSRFPKLEKLEIEYPENLPSSEIQYYKATKEITLSNNTISTLEIEYGFKNNKLIRFNILLNIGKNGAQYFKELIDILMKNDTNRINSYLYAQQKYFYLELKRGCYKIFSLTRDQSNAKEFNVDIRYKYEGEL